MDTPSRQEMFDRAWNGLKSQGWRKAMVPSGCVYLTADGRRCAWGWVDPDGTSDKSGTVYGLLTNWGNACGLFARLDYDDREWASALQNTHDLAKEGELEASMREFAKTSGLKVPD